MLTPAISFAAVRRDFSWKSPEHYNIGADVCDRWADGDPDRLAIIDVAQNRQSCEYTFAHLKAMSNRLANALSRRGIGRRELGAGDRIGILLPQRVETAVAHIASAKMGCVSVPLFTLFGPDALHHRLADSGAKAIVTDRVGLGKLIPLLDRLPALEVMLCVDGAHDVGEGFTEVCSVESELYQVALTRADDPAILIYTSGTTGSPKGALHAHRVLLGHLPGVEISHDFLPQTGDRFWTPADWAWIGGLLDVLMPALHHGIPVVACRFEKFTAESAVDLIKMFRVRNAFLPPTALKMMKLFPQAKALQGELRSIASGGETLGGELLDWARRTLGVTINEFYGQTECNMVVSSCGALEEPMPGTMGYPVPGHVVDVIDALTGKPVPNNIEGAIAVRAPDPVMFLGYWNNPKATREKFVDGEAGKWLIMGDRGIRDSRGRIRFLGRDDDIIGSAGYRIGPAEVEECLITHPAVRLAGVVGKPDRLRDSVVAAFVVLRDGFEPSDSLAEEIAGFVKSRLAAHEYPRVVRFIKQMPMTTTGKIIRRTLRQLAEEEAQRDGSNRCA